MPDPVSIAKTFKFLSELRTAIRLDATRIPYLLEDPLQLVRYTRGGQGCEGPYPWQTGVPIDGQQKVSALELEKLHADLFHWRGGLRGDQFVVREAGTVNLAFLAFFYDVPDVVLHFGPEVMLPRRCEGFHEAGMRFMEDVEDSSPGCTRDKDAGVVQDDEAGRQG